MTTEENKELVRRFSRVWQDRNFDVLDEILATDFVAHRADGSEIPGAAGWKQFVMDTYSESSEIDTAGDPAELIANGDLVAELWSWRSIDNATGKELRGRGVTMHRIAGGRLQENWAVFEEQPHASE